MHRLQHGWVTAHAKVVIGAPNRDLVLGRFFVGSREFLGQSVDVVEVAVGLVLVLLVQLALIVRLVVEVRDPGTLSFASVSSVGICGLLRRSGKWN